jgi:signal transduction histidine kinase
VTRRLVLFGLLVCAAAVAALVVPLGVSARDTVRAAAIDEAQARAQETAVLLSGSGVGAVDALLPGAPAGDGTLSVVLPDGSVLGPDPGPGLDPAFGAARTGRAVTVENGDGVLAASPATGPDGTSVVLVGLGAADLRTGLGPSLTALALAGGVLLAAAAVTAVVLARRTAAPLTEMAGVAHEMADGDLEVRAATSGVTEVAEVGVALNRLAGRVQELLAAERRSSADLAHRLRTPLTALAVDLDAVQDGEVRARLRDDLDAVQVSVDEIITSRRRPEREGLRAVSDAVEVVAARTAFWAVLAEDQQRPLQVRLAAGPLWVRLPREDLEAAIDVVLQNVFVHTTEGTGMTVEVVSGTQGGAVISVEDAGPGWSSASATRPGSTGLGLDIAARAAEASGGELRRETAMGGGAKVRLALGPPSD